MLILTGGNNVYYFGCIISSCYLLVEFASDGGKDSCRRWCIGSFYPVNCLLLLLLLSEKRNPFITTWYYACTTHSAIKRTSCWQKSGAIRETNKLLITGSVILVNDMDYGVDIPYRLKSSSIKIFVGQYFRHFGNISVTFYNLRVFNR